MLDHHQVTPTIPSATLGRRLAPWFLAAAGLGVVVFGALFTASDYAATVPLAAIAIAAGVLALRNVAWAFVLLFATLLLRLAIPRVLPVDPFLVAFLLLVVSGGVWLLCHPANRPRIGPTEYVMLAYVAWNLFSILQQHDLPAMFNPEFGAEQPPTWRYLLIGTVIPFAAYYLARATFTTVSAVRILIGSLLAFSTFSAVMSILQFTGPNWLVWPRYIVENPNWVGRANGVLNQPGANGVVLITGYAVAILVASTLEHPPWRRLTLWGIAAACGMGVYLTHTRAVYLGFIVVVVAGALLAKGFRRPFLTTLGVAVVGVTVNWSNFISADRDAGGIGSTNEVYDRLNADVTAVWAFTEKPWTGWGLGRFLTINTYHHQSWSDDVPWVRGLNVASHFNELGILAELGLIGLVLWIAVMGLVVRTLVDGVRHLDPADFMGRPLALTALMSLTALVILGVFADLRLLDYPNVTVFALAGATAGALDRYRSPLVVAPYQRIPRLTF